MKNNSSRRKRSRIKSLEHDNHTHGTRGRSSCFNEPTETIKKEGENRGEDARIQNQPLAEATGTGKQTPDNNNSKDADTLLVNSNYKALENSAKKEEEKEDLDAFSGKKTSSPKNDNLNSFSVR